MIDLRSDTLTQPDLPMLETILTAPVGDDGRIDENGRGEDPTVNKPEDLAASLTGKEAGLLCCSGSMTNLTALLTWCRPGDRVLVNNLQHLDKSEKTAFSPRFGQLQRATYPLDEDFQPDLNVIEDQLKKGGISLLCLENTHNFSGGTCITEESLKQIYTLAQQYHVPVHTDGVRIFNAALHLKTTVARLCQYTDSVDFSLSKSLAAPIGSLLCGTNAFIREARDTRKMIGGGMRQAGIIAAPGIYALEHNRDRLQEDHDHCALCASLLQDLNAIVSPNPKAVQTNILLLDVTPTGLSNHEFCRKAKEQGLLINPILDKFVRMIFYKGITTEDVRAAAQILHTMDKKYR